MRSGAHTLEESLEIGKKQEGLNWDLMQKDNGNCLFLLGQRRAQC